MADGFSTERSLRPASIRVAVYARVSTSNNGQDPSMQTRDLREYCERRGWQVTAEYIDIGISGARERSGPNLTD
jgi:DNA invertase Pin-like site-specific DNA recombinase